MVFPGVILSTGVIVASSPPNQTETMVLILYHGGQKCMAGLLRKVVCGGCDFSSFVLRPD